MSPRIKRALTMFSRKVHRLTGRAYNPLHSLLLAKSYAKIVERRIAAEDYDILFAPAGSTEIALVRTGVPIVYLSDATFALIHNYYPSFSNLLRVSVWEGHLIERLAVRKARAVVFATEWAAESARNDYRAQADKVHVVPFGANLDTVPDRNDALSRKTSSACRLLFVGTDWMRKGGDIAFETLVELEKRGVMAELVACGCRPPSRITHPRLTVIPFLNKSDPDQQARLVRLLSWADLFLLPTRAECSGIVFCEANAFGIPVVTTDTGGVSCVVKHGRNGILLPPAARGPEYAEKILELTSGERQYRALVDGSRTAFEQRLNWDVWGQRLASVIAQAEGRSTHFLAHHASEA
jgi:glycosyltransferase involved in cell wall biosynthesis